MKKFFLSVVLLTNCLSVFGCRKFLHIETANQKNNSSNSSYAIVYFPSCSQSAHSLPDAPERPYVVVAKRHSVDLSGSAPIDISERKTHNRSPSFPEILTNTLRETMPEESSSPMSVSSTLMSRSPNSESTSVLSVGSTPSSTSSSSESPRSAMMYNLTQESCNEAGIQLEPAKTQALAKILTAKLLNVSLQESKSLIANSQQ